MKLRRGDSSDRTDVALADLIRRLQSRGIQTAPFEDGYILSAGTTFEVYFFDDPVPGPQVVRIAEVFQLDIKVLYFDRVEDDFN